MIIGLSRRFSQPPQGSSVRLVRNLQCLACAGILTNEYDSVLPVVRANKAWLRNILALVSQDLSVRRMGACGAGDDSCELGGPVDIGHEVPNG